MSNVFGWGDYTRGGHIYEKVIIVLKAVSIANFFFFLLVNFFSKGWKPTPWPKFLYPRLRSVDFQGFCHRWNIGWWSWLPDDRLFDEIYFLISTESKDLLIGQRSSDSRSKTVYQGIVGKQSQAFDQWSPDCRLIISFASSYIIQCMYPQHLWNKVMHFCCLGFISVGFCYEYYSTLCWI